MIDTSPLPAEPEDHVLKLTTSTPPDRWFTELYGDQWRNLPVNTRLQIDYVSAAVPEFGGPVVHLVTIPDNLAIVIPQAWFTRAHFRKIAKNSGQQPYPFLEPHLPQG